MRAHPKTQDPTPRLHPVRCHSFKSKILARGPSKKSGWRAFDPPPLTGHGRPRGVSRGGPPPPRSQPFWWSPLMVVPVVDVVVVKVKVMLPSASSPCLSGVSDPCVHYLSSVPLLRPFLQCLRQASSVPCAPLPCASPVGAHRVRAGVLLALRGCKFGMYACMDVRMFGCMDVWM